jgi:peroxiredoxin
MPRKRLILAAAVPLVIGVLLLGAAAVRVVKQAALERAVEDLRSQATTQAKDRQFVQAADTFERLQVLCMDSGRYQDALDASRVIEDVSRHIPGRRSPWNFVRIAEAYLGMGDRDRYFEWMQKAVDERSFSKVSYFQGTRLDPLRRDPRFTRLVAASSALVGVGTPARDFEVTLLDGSTFALSAQKGKVVVIDFWYVLCAPCREELPSLRAIHAEFKDQGLVMVGISLDTDRKLLDDYVKQAAIPWNLACSLGGWDDPTVKLYRISATPSTWVIDRHGVVRYYDLRGEALRRAVEALVRES